MWTLIFLLHGMISSPQAIRGFASESDCRKAGDEVVAKWPTANYVCIETPAGKS